MAWIAPRDWVANDVLTAAQLNIDVRDNGEFLKAYISPDKSTELTIAGGIITVTQTYHRVDTSGPASEDLKTIAGVAEGQIVILRAENAARTVVLKHGTGNLILGYDISLDDTNKHVALIYDGTNMHLLYSARDVTFMANAFQYPNPTVEWKPNTGGACLPVDQTTVVVYLPLNFLKIGDVIISYNLIGAINAAGAASLTCKLVQVNLNHPVDTTDIGNGAIDEQTADNIFDATASVDDKTVATDEMYYLLITGTTDATATITVMGAEVLVRRLV